MTDRFFEHDGQVWDTAFPGEYAPFGDFKAAERAANKLNSGLGKYTYSWNVSDTVPAQPDEPVDMVNEPPHYKFDDGVEVIDLTEQLNFNCGNAVKYIARAGRKSSDPVQDLEKAEFYVKRELERVKRRASV